MTTLSPQTPQAQEPAGRVAPSGPACIALLGNPNAGKTTLFNALTGLRAKTANFPGTTVEHRAGRVMMGGQVVQLLDLPGLYSLAAATPDERVARDALLGHIPGMAKPTLAVLILDATNLERNLYLASQVLELEIPTIVALNMTDLAKRDGIRIHTRELSGELGCPVIPIVARKGTGIERLRRLIEQTLETAVGSAAAAPSDLHAPIGIPVVTATPAMLPTPATPTALPQILPPAEIAADDACGCSGCPFQARYEWAEGVGARCSSGRPETHGRRTEKIDQFLTHPVIGVGAFLAVMFQVFCLIFWIAQYPMDWIDMLFAGAGSLLSSALPDGDLRSLLVEGVVGGVGGMLVFLPQICILFFFLALLEDTGYLARAAFVMDRLMRRVGLPGKAFVPLLSAHACAIPAIMSTRVIEDRRDRLVTILVAPLMTCAARIPVYAMVTALLFSHRPMMAGLVFTGAYSLGIVAALVMAFVFKHTILRGESQPLVLELPSYKLPSLRNAAIMAADRALVFVKKAGTVILMISIGLWFLATFPKSEAPASVVALEQQALVVAADGDVAQSEAMLAQADTDRAHHALANSFAGRLGRAIEPVIRPLGFDWQIGVGIVSSFAAREVIVSTLAIVYGVGADTADDNPDSLYDTMRKAQRSDGGPVFTTATCMSLLVFYVLAMQCLPTQAVTRRETNSWKWPAFQLAYMTVLAYTASLVTYQAITLSGLG